MTLLLHPLVMNNESAASSTSSFDKMMDKAMSGQQQRLPFPLQLYKLLELAEESGDTDIVSWLPCGTAFRVHDRDKFAKKFMKTFFKQSVFKSFLRQLNMWGFQRVVDGSAKGAYQHHLFRRGEPDRCHGMVRGGLPPESNEKGGKDDGTSSNQQSLLNKFPQINDFSMDPGVAFPMRLSQLVWPAETSPMAASRKLCPNVCVSHHTIVKDVETFAHVLHFVFTLNFISGPTVSLDPYTTGPNFSSGISSLIGNPVNHHSNSNHNTAFLPSIHNHNTSHVVGTAVAASQQSPFEEQLDERQTNNGGGAAASSSSTSVLNPRSVELMTLDNVPPLERARQDDDFEVVLRNFLHF